MAMVEVFMKIDGGLSANYLREILNYDPETGIFTWKVCRGSSRAGNVAGSKGGDGYTQISINGKSYKAHRVAWLYVTGEWPEYQVDHRNGVKHDNKWNNLREATQAQNGQNQKLRRTNVSGYLGVCWCAKYSKWQAQIMVNKRNRFLGIFDDPAEAHNAYLAAKAELHEFQRVPRDIESSAPFSSQRVAANRR